MTLRKPAEPPELGSLIIGFTSQMAELSKNVGELTGQMREQIHTSNNNAHKLDILGDRILAMEKINERREGANSILQLVLKSPALGWVFLAAVAFWAFLTGKMRA